jgi:hypothetical protein
VLGLSHVCCFPRLQVLRHLPKRFSADVFCALTDSSGSLVEGFELALHLPQDLLSCWVASTPAVLDLRAAELPALRRSRLLAALAQEDSHLTEIHLPVVSRGCMSATEVCRVPQEVEEETKCEEREHLPVGVYDEEECNQYLNTLAGVLPQLPSLRHLGLQYMPLQAPVLPALGQVLLALPPSVTALTLSVARSRSIDEDDIGPLQRGMLFSAIAMVRSLRELHMPNWEAAVGYDEDCIEPLFNLPHLEAVYVTKVKENGA